MGLSDDWLAIGNALSTYVVALDSRDLGLFDLVFTKDAKIDLVGVGVFSPEEYASMCEKSLPQFDATHHHLGLPVISIQGDTAHARTYFTAQHTINALAPQPHFMIGGWYDDDLVRTADGWRIAHKTGTAVWSDGNPKVLGYDGEPGASPRAPGHSAPAWLTKR